VVIRHHGRASLQDALDWIGSAYKLMSNVGTALIGWTNSRYQKNLIRTTNVESTSAREYEVVQRIHRYMHYAIIIEYAPISEASSMAFDAMFQALGGVYTSLRHPLFHFQLHMSMRASFKTSGLVNQPARDTDMSIPHRIRSFYLLSALRTDMREMRLRGQ